MGTTSVTASSYNAAFFDQSSISESLWSEIEGNRSILLWFSWKHRANIIIPRYVSRHSQYSSSAMIGTLNILLQETRIIDCPRWSLFSAHYRGGPERNKACFRLIYLHFWGCGRPHRFAWRRDSIGRNRWAGSLCNVRPCIAFRRARQAYPLLMIFPRDLLIELPFRSLGNPPHRPGSKCSDNRSGDS